MIALRGEIAALSKQVVRLFRDRSRNRSRRRYGKSPYRSKTPSRRVDYNFNDDFCYYHNRFGSKAKKMPGALYFCPGSGKLMTVIDAPFPIIGADFLKHFDLIIYLKRQRLINTITNLSRFCKIPTGNENITADSLSRIASIEMPNPINYDEIAKSQESDLELQNLISNPQGLQLKKIVMPKSDIPLFCDLSTGTARPYIPKEYRHRIFSQLHNMPHPGIRVTTKLILFRFVCPSIGKDCSTWSKYCIPCQKAKVIRHTKNPLGFFPDQTRRFDHMHLDVIGPFPPSDGNYYCLTMIEGIYVGNRMLLLYLQNTDIMVNHNLMENCLFNLSHACSSLVVIVVNSSSGIESGATEERLCSMTNTVYQNNTYEGYLITEKALAYFISYVSLEE
ncbi:gag-pol polyprotein [Nephila pilipes]|uniref:Gag-pol polyprotein n=1 Tax=Nephila pilipes TaxID=299642 RepID=A0A8X6QTP6_NEPPI|nr:gag-pol polyprotein [Nephila pilipes]